MENERALFIKCTPTSCWICTTIDIMALQSMPGTTSIYIYI